MILSTPRAVRDSTSAATAASTAETATRRGEEMLGSWGVTAPITPIGCPPASATALAASLPPSTRACRAGSAVKSRLAATNGTGGSNPPMKRAVTSGPRSKSWLPRPMASYRPLRAVES